MDFDIPQSMEVEHEHLHSDLVRLTGSGGQTGEAAKAVAKLLHPHFVKENEYALPPLGLLVPLAQGKFDPAMTKVLELTDRLAADMSAMLAEHQAIVAALRTLTDLATIENRPDALRFAEMLEAHARMEEEVTYPTSLLVGLYVRSRLAQVNS